MLSSPLVNHPQYSASVLATTAAPDGAVITEHRVTPRRNNVGPCAFLPLVAIVLAWGLWWRSPNPLLAKALLAALPIAIATRWRVLYRECEPRVWLLRPTTHPSEPPRRSATTWTRVEQLSKLARDPAQSVADPRIGHATAWPRRAAGHGARVRRGPQLHGTAVRAS